MTDDSSQDSVSPASVLATASPGSPLAQLVDEPFRLEFFQAVRLIQLAAADDGPTGKAPGSARHGVLPYEEHVRFRARIGHGFPANQIASLEMVTSTIGRRSITIPELTISFLGLAGTAGILPAHYTQLLIDRAREKDVSLRDFLDLFNHRLIAQFYRAWEKSHFYVGYERTRRETGERTDRFSQMLYSLVGMGTPGLRGRQAFSDEALLHYAGHWSRLPRSAMALEQILSGYFRVPAAVHQFQGQWMYLTMSDRTRLSSDTSGALNNALGVSAIAGTRVWGIENKIRIRLGVLSYEQFREFLPSGAGYVALGQLVRSFIGPAMDFDLQLVLARQDVPRCQLTRGGGMQLGWNTWLFSGAATRDVDDAVFRGEGTPLH